MSGELVGFSPELARQTKEVVRRLSLTPRQIPPQVDASQVRALRDTIPIHNNSGAEIPQYGLILLKAYEADYVTVGADQFDYPGISTIGIATAAIANGINGRAWIAGIHPVLCAAYAAIVFQSRIAPQAASFYAAAFALGPLLVVGEVAAGYQPGGLPAGVGLVKARIDHWRP